MKHRSKLLLPISWSAAILVAVLASVASAAEHVVKVGSKAFTESIVLGELAKQIEQRAGLPAIHRANLGGTKIAWEAMRVGDIDLYPDYTGTIVKEILASENIHGEAAFREALEKHGVRMTRPLGFNNRYDLAMKEEKAQNFNIRTISDLVKHPELRFGFSSEFMGRADGWPGLRDRYGLPQRDVRGLEHTLAYQGLDSGAIDVTEVYGTDPQIRAMGLRVLLDDRHFFPEYYAVYLYRKQLETDSPAAVTALKELEGRIPIGAIIEMNARAQSKKVGEPIEAQMAAEFLAGNPNPYFRTDDAPDDNLPPVSSLTGIGSVFSEILNATIEHLGLVAISLSAAVLIAIPLGILAARRPKLGHGILAAVGTIQTMPSLALLVFLIPLLGLGAAPAIVALFLYSLLPMVRNTYAGLHDLPVQIRESAEALGLTPWARLRLIDLPMASRSILAGVKTSAVINVGTATLGGIVGAGGYGQQIMDGVRLANNWIILEGAIPAALLALAVQGLFELSERFLVPRGLRLKVEG